MRNRVRVRHHPRTGAWETGKYRGDELVASAVGSDFEHAMIQTALVGLAADEPDGGEFGPRTDSGVGAAQRSSI